MIRRQVIMPVTPERLWDALTDPDEMAGGSGPGSNGPRTGLAGPIPRRRRPRPGRAGGGGRPGRHLRFRWWPTRPAPGVTGRPR